MKLQEWMNQNPIPDEMLWREAAYQQFNFIKDTCLRLFKEDADEVLSVVGSHMSKSILLPVYQFQMPTAGTGGFCDNLIPRPRRGGAATQSGDRGQVTSRRCG